MMPLPRRLLAVSLLVVVVSWLTACGGGDDKDATPTATAFAPGTTGSVISDGICQAIVPDDWVSDGTGHGSTPSGARFALFGGKLISDASWPTAEALVATQAAAQPLSTVEHGDGRIIVRSSNDRTYSIRVQLPDRYCDFSLASSAAIPAAELELLPAIESSLAAAKT